VPLLVLNSTSSSENVSAWGGTSIGRLVGKLLLKLCSDEKSTRGEFFFTKILSFHFHEDFVFFPPFFFHLYLFFSLSNLRILHPAEAMDDVIQFLEPYFEIFCCEYFKRGIHATSDAKNIFSLSPFNEMEVLNQFINSTKFSEE
jgi:hypothetical protein